MDFESGPLSNEVPRGSDDLIDAIARIELERQERAREVGDAAACAGALRELRALHASEKEALRAGGMSSEHSANLAALAAELRRVEKLSGGSSRLPTSHGKKRESKRESQPGAQRTPARRNARQNARRKGSPRR